jgi:hypothetical protein
MQIDCSDKQSEKAPSPILETLESLSNVTAERFLHSQKHNGAMASTDEGTEMNFTPRQ